MSTPIETNTEQLQEVLQQVYNLPNRSGGGGDSYDVLFRYERPSGEDSFSITNNDLTNSSFSIESGNMTDVRNKLQAGEPVKAGVIILVYYWDNPFCGFADVLSLRASSTNGYTVGAFVLDSQSFNFSINNDDSIQNFWLTT